MKNIAIVGATGAVGRAFLELLAEHPKFSAENIILFASERSAGSKISFKGKMLDVKLLDENFYKGIDLAFFSAGASTSLKYAPIAAENGVYVVDNSSAFRMNDDIPLIVPEVNAYDLKALKSKIIANPNCSTIQMCAAIVPLHSKYGLKRIIASTYQATSGAGAQAMQELLDQTQSFVKKEPIVTNKFSREILFNAIPQIDMFLDNNYTKEEMKLVYETRKIFSNANLPISSTCVRIPTLRCHGEALTIELERKFSSIDEIVEVLKQEKNLVIHAKQEDFPTPRELEKTQKVHIGRIRKDLAFDNAVSLWVVADQIYKGAALNAIQIAELLDF